MKGYYIMVKFLNTKPKVILFILGILLLIVIAAVIAGLLFVNTYKNPADKELENAGITEKTAQVGTITFHYAEGPDNGPALVLLV